MAQKRRGLFGSHLIDISYEVTELNKITFFIFYFIYFIFIFIFNYKLFYFIVRDQSKKLNTITNLQLELRESMIKEERRHLVFVILC